MDNKVAVETVSMIPNDIFTTGTLYGCIVEVLEGKGVNCIGGMRRTRAGARARAMASRSRSFCHCCCCCCLAD
jgi:hypothetical protein